MPARHSLMRASSVVARPRASVDSQAQRARGNEDQPHFYDQKQAEPSMFISL